MNYEQWFDPQTQTQYVPGYGKIGCRFCTWWLPMPNWFVP